MIRLRDMLVVGNLVIDESILTSQFACKLTACKGACCVQGDGGAPLEPEETQILEQEFENFSPFLLAEGRSVVAEQGPWLRAEDGMLETPLVGGKECAYAVFEDGVALCGIERAFQAGKTTFQKPISCHLYPIRVTVRGAFTYLRYDEWDICAPACVNGRRNKVPLYQFLKTAIIRQYGEDVYAAIDEYASLRQTP